MNDAFRQMFDQVRSGVIWLTRDGTVRYANKAAMQLAPCLLGSAIPDPMIDRSVKAAGQDLVTMPFHFEFQTSEANPDTVKAVVLPAPVGKDLMLVLNNISEERWYSLALENLIHYLEAEIAEPSARLAQDLARLRRAGSALLGDEMAGNAETLSKRLNKLRNLVGVFGHGAIRADERVEVPELLQQSIKDLAGVLDHRNVQVKLQYDPPLPAVYASRTWLAKAFSEYLEQAVLSAPRGAVLDLELNGVGTRLILRSRHKGLFLTQHERRSAFVPFGVGDGEPAQERQGIGLALARYIVEQLGGSVRIEDEFDEVNFVMELPAGAPASQDAQLSVEQAQRYARDMSQLISRSLKRKGTDKATP
jgi:signal transduction histidine kinase